jgi:3-hydroxyisobutyrate dehydrogenase-like beta-hydroxyacid dehydrogenase
MARIGFLGTGLMGDPMVRRLLAAGHEVHIWNRSAAKAERLRSVGAVVAESPRAVAANTEMIALCLTDAAAVEAVLFAEAGACARKGLNLLDFTSMSPPQCSGIANKLRAAGTEVYVDAPVSGGVAGATQGSLVVMCGGHAEHVTRFKPILDAVAARVTHMGATGAGQMAKLCNQHIVASSVIAMAEAIALARRSGVEVARLPQALEGGFADSRAFRLWGVRMATGSWEPNVGALDTMWKDVRNLSATMQSLGLELPLARAVQDIYADISAAGRGRDDLGSIASFFDNDKT